MKLGEMANFQNLNFANESHLVKNIYQESFGHFMFGLTFWQVDFWEVDHFSKYYFLQLLKEERFIEQLGNPICVQY